MVDKEPHRLCSGEWGVDGGVGEMHGVRERAQCVRVLLKSTMLQNQHGGHLNQVPGLSGSPHVLVLGTQRVLRLSACPWETWMPSPVFQ